MTNNKSRQKSNPGISLNCYDIGSMVLYDLDALNRSRSPVRPDDALLASVVDKAYQQVSSMALAYTAFDGDHHMLCDWMRSTMLKKGVIPVNPPAVVGYKNSVDAHPDKRFVLYDDLSLMRRCNTIWCISSSNPNVRNLPYLAEGAVLEILTFCMLQKTEDVTITWLRVPSIFKSHQQTPTINAVKVNTEQLKRSVRSVLPEILCTAEKAVTKLSLLNPVAYIISDPLDTKYSDWSRQYAFRWAPKNTTRSRGVVPLHPFKSIPVSDAFAISKYNLTDACRYAAQAWLRLTDIADMFIVHPKMNKRIGRSLVVDAFVDFVRRRGESTVEFIDWKKVGVPKALDRSSWALSIKEQNEDNSFESWINDIEEKNLYLLDRDICSIINETNTDNNYSTYGVIVRRNNRRITSSLKEWVLIDGDDTIWHDQHKYLEIKEDFLDSLHQFNGKNGDANFYSIESIDALLTKHSSQNGYGVFALARVFHMYLESILPELYREVGRSEGNKIKLNLVEKIKQATIKIINSSVTTIPGVKRGLQRLRDEGWGLALYTRGPCKIQLEKAVASGTADYFDAFCILKTKSNEAASWVLSTLNSGDSTNYSWVIGNSLTHDIAPFDSKIKSVFLSNIPDWTEAKSLNDSKPAPNITAASWDSAIAAILGQHSIGPRELD